MVFSLVLKAFAKKKSSTFIEAKYEKSGIK